MSSTPRSGALGRQIAVVAALSLFIVGPASAAEVQGALALDKYQPAAKDPVVPNYRWELENGMKEVLPDRVPARELSVVVTGGGPARTESELRVQISGGELLPSTLVVRTGTTLKIENADDVAHELSAPGLDGFSPEATGPRSQRGVALSKAGNWAIVDGLTPHSRAHLYVIDDLVAVATLNDSGAFTFGDLPDGSYTVHVFHGGQELATAELAVAGKPVSLDSLTLEPRSAR